MHGVVRWLMSALLMPSLGSGQTENGIVSDSLQKHHSTSMSSVIVCMELKT
jgi:hypothetical protein